MPTQIFRLTLIAAMSVLAVAVPARADEAILPAYETLEVRSQVLGETRKLVIYTPPGHDAARPVPTVYVTDARANFELLVSFLRFSASDWSTLPPMAVVGILNTDRNRDFLPREDPRFAGSGGGDAFAAFLEEELVPAVEKRIGEPSARILVGHSFGGVNALNMMLTRPQVFDAHIAIGASTWVADQVLFERARARFATTEALDEWLYMSVAEADGGRTVPDGVAFAQMLDARAPAGLDHRFEIIPQTDHFSAVPPSIHSAFSQLFDGWKSGRSVLGAARSGGAKAVKRWFDERAEQLGWRFHPPAWDMYVAALTLNDEGHRDAALAVLARMQSIDPHLAELFAAEGEVHLAAANPEQALDAFARALELAREQDFLPPRRGPIEARFKELSN